MSVFGSIDPLKKDNSFEVNLFFNQIMLIFYIDIRFRLYD